MLLIFSESIINSKAANTIQTKSTSFELSKHTNVITFYRSNNIILKFDKISEQSTNLLIFGPKNLLGSIFYLFLSVSFLVLFRIRYFFLKDKLKFYGRNLYISFIASCLCIAGAYELHDIPNSIQNFLLKISIKFKKVSIIVITNSLRDDLSKALGKQYSKKIFTIADSHNFNFNHDDINKKKSRELKKFKLGYFGSLHTYKGSKLLFEIARELNYEIDIFTKDLERLPDDILKHSKCLYAPHEDIQDLMLEYDICFLFLVNTNEFDDVSKYTSPLKLFEYMAAGVVTICSDHPVLKEVVSNQDVQFVENNRDSIISSIRMLSLKKDIFKLKQRNAIENSFKYTYKERANKIIKIINENRL